MQPTRYYVRKNVWELDDDWADPILWYARGVAAMKARPLSDPLSWRFYAAIHGYDEDLWKKLGFLTPSDSKPGPVDVDTFWRQCQHDNWFFLPWHRGYLLAFEATIRAEVVRLDGPDDWALPYWNYFKPNQNQLPPAFASPDWPDGQGSNPLFIPQRWGPDGTGIVYVDVNEVGTDGSILDLDALNEPEFTGSAVGGSTGFGGLDPGLNHRGDAAGGIELEPHNNVHVQVGGDDPGPEDPDTFRNDGLMSEVETAGLDPIFWLHHANIDRLWEVWHRPPKKIPPNSTHHKDPLDLDRWADGPIGEGKFRMPMPGDRTWHFTPRAVSHLEEQGYTYDDLCWPAPTPTAKKTSERLGRLRGSAAAVRDMEKDATVSGDNVELVGANRGLLQIVGSEARTSIQLNTGVRRRVSASLATAAAATGSVPDRTFLNLENVRGRSNAPLLQVYLGPAQKATQTNHAEQLAGRVGLFGVRSATEVGGRQSGQGLTFVLDVTHIIDNMYVNGLLDDDELAVRIVPMKPVRESAQVSIGRVSIYRQGD